MLNNRIELSTPTSRAMGRMTTILFRPFDLGKWFVLGVSAWLATLGEQSGSSFQFNSGGSSPTGTDGEEVLKGYWDQAVTFFNENTSLVVGVGIALVVLVITLTVLFQWLSSRGRFMLLDNVVHNRALVKVPWSEFKAQGNSLFLWRFIVGFIAVLIFGSILGAAGYYIYANVDFNFKEIDEAAFSQFMRARIGWIIGVSAVGLLITIGVSYVFMLLNDFVVPIMYKHSISVTEGWRRALAIHNSHVGSFILYFLWRFLLMMGGAVAVLVFILVTCCIGGIFLAVPYLGAVLMLPITLFFRGLGPEYLRQFGAEFDLWEGSLDNFAFTPGPPPLEG